MSVIQIILGVIIFISCFLIIVLAIAQAKKAQDMGNAFSGESAQDSFFGKTGKGGSSRDDAMASLTKVMGITFFVATLLLNILMAYGL